MSVLDAVKSQITNSYSISKLTALMGFMVASFVVVWQAIHGTLSDATFGLYFGFITAIYLGAKKISGDQSNDSKAIDVNAPQPPPDKPQ